MRSIVAGHLRVLTPSHAYDFPAPSVQNDNSPSLKSELRVVSDAFWIRLYTMGDLGFAEAYMYGDVEIEVDDLVLVFHVSSSVMSHSGYVELNWPLDLHS
jgi:cyclopropane-fatty-acyl-phospholipid synthase